MIEAVAMAACSRTRLDGAARSAAGASGRAVGPLRRDPGGSAPPPGGGRVRVLRPGGAGSRRSGRSQTFAEGLGQAYDHVLVLGIGGSALGTKALLNALRRPAWNELDDEGREFFPRLTVLENVDPTHGRRGARADRPAPGPGQRDQQVGRHRGDDGAVPRGPRMAGGGAGGRGLIATSCSRPIPTRGALRELAHARGDRDARRAAGGRRTLQRALARSACCRRRWSASTSRRLLSGAREALRPRGARTTCCGIRAALYAALHWAADTDLGARIHVLMPYTDRLREFAEWYRQLWAESLGKRVDRDGRVGARGPDAGRRRSAPPTSTARSSSSWRVPTTRSSPSSRWSSSDLRRPCRFRRAGRTCRRTSPTFPATPWGSCSTAEYEATSAALAADGADELHPAAPRPRPPPRWGRPIMFFQLATGYAGVWYGINPFDQPGVELGKR